MCLMCEYYYESCTNDECYDAAVNTEEKYVTNNKLPEHRRKMFLHKGYTGPCKHMREEHGPHCDVIEPKPSEYGLVYDTCTCYNIGDGEWEYDRDL